MLHIHRHQACLLYSALSYAHSTELNLQETRWREGKGGKSKKSVMDERPVAPRVPTVVPPCRDADELHRQLRTVCLQLLPEWKVKVKSDDDVQVECLLFIRILAFMLAYHF